LLLGRGSSLDTSHQCTADCC